VPDGALHYLPFCLLLTEPPPADATTPASPQAAAPPPTPDVAPPAWDRQPYLLRRHAIWYAQSATIAGMLHREVVQRAGVAQYSRELVAFGDPLVTDAAGTATPRPAAAADDDIALESALGHARGTLAPLPNTAAEVWGLAQLMSPGIPRDRRPEVYADDKVVVRIGGAAAKNAVIDLTSGGESSRFFHVASHGILDAEKPQFSGLVFTPNEAGERFWQTFEIFNARIHSEMVVLSACETGLGALFSGEGIVGLTRAFMYAGAAAVCVSLWKVADESTPGLMSAFYKGVLGGATKARALRAAQLDCLENSRYQHPFYWAPFILTGEGR
jgi:hypothetical protein